MKDLFKKGLIVGLSVILAAGFTACSKNESQETEKAQSTETSDDGIVINDDGSMSVDPSKAGIDVEEMNPNPTEKEEEIFKASEFTAPYKESYEYPHMGLKFSLGKFIKDAIESKELVLLDEQENEDGPGNVKYGLFTISSLNEDQKNAEISTLGDGYVEWLNSIERVGNVGMFRSDMTEEEIKEVSKNDSLLKLGESKDKNFVYYLTYKDINKTSDQCIRLIDQLNGLVVDTLAISTANEIQDNKKKIPVFESLEKILQTYRPQLEKKTIELKISKTNDIIYMSDLSFERLMDNLISNAIKYSHENGNIEIYIEDQKFYIKNTGDLMTDEEISKAFDLNYTKNREGNGLGLYIVKNILLMNGLTYNLKRTDKGMVFSFSLS